MMSERHHTAHKRNSIAIILVMALFLSLPWAAANGDKTYAAGTEYTTTVTGTVRYEMAWQVLDHVNSQRIARGLAPLVMSADLLNVARQRAAEISLYFSHTRPSGLGPSTAVNFPLSGMMAENIATGQGSAASVMDDWMNSPGHRENILRSNITEIGIGCFIDETGWPYWVQFFSSRPFPVGTVQPANGMETFNILANTDYVSKVTFDARGGSPSPVRYRAHEPAGSETVIGRLPTSERKGYLFGGWYTAVSGGAKVEESTKVSANLILYARWTPVKYTVKFNVNKGKALKKSLAKKSVAMDVKYGKLPAPTRKGYRFSGWYTKKVGGEKVIGAKRFSLAKNITLYAHWKKVKTKKGNRT